MKIKRIFFDLDGTVLDTSPGMFASVRYTARKLGYPEPTTEQLRAFIGPPLAESMRNTFKPQESELIELIRVYRKHFTQFGIDQFQIYDEIPAALKLLRQNYELYITTSKPEVFAEKTIESAGLSDLFSAIYGADLAGRRVKKADVLRCGMQQLSYVPSERTVLIGDRNHDVLGAKEVGIKSIGVLYGFGKYAELKTAGADKIISSPLELVRLFDKTD